MTWSFLTAARFLYWSGSSRETESIGYVYFQKEISYKELAHVIVEARRSRDLQGVSAGWRLRKAETLVLVCVPKPETQEEPVFPFKPKGGKKVDIPVWRLSGSQHSYLWVVSLFVPVRSSADGTRPVHMMEDSLLSSVYQYVNLIQNQPHRPTQNNVGPNIWALDGSVKLT